MMVKNSTNINKTNNNISTKERLNSDIVVCFVDIGGIVDHHYLTFLGERLLFVLLILEELLTITV
jgi:hypothetical protein